MSKHNFIIIEGNIGAGKTTLVNMISERFNAKKVLEEFADNPFLPKFYKDPNRYSFPLELSFLAARYNQLKKELASQDLFKSFTIADYYFMKSLIFSKNTLIEDEFHLYRQLFNIIYNQLPKPDLYVYLHVPVNSLLQKIKKRGRSYESDISADYLLKIQKGYFDFFNQQNELKILILDTNEIDFVNNSYDFDKIADVILNNDYKIGINQVLVSKILH